MRTSTEQQVAAQRSPSPWWRSAVVYQVYLRSFADSNGDGIGDLAGLRSRLPYLSWLGVDALWINPHYPSGGADGGYDICDYRAVDPDYGDVADLEALVADARQLGLRVVLDVVPNHTSDQHPWFQAALADPDSPEAARYHFAPPSEEPPNNWRSLFGGPAWSRTPDGRWYLHLFAPEQPDLNWRDPAVAADFEKTLRFWLDRGVSGFRVDVAYGLFKDADLRDNPGAYSPTLFGHGPEQAMTWNQPEVHDVWRQWRSVCDEYPDTMLVGEVCLADLDEVALYSRSDEMHQSFSFRLLKSPWETAAFADGVQTALDAFGRVGAPVSWVLGNHDKDRQVTRFGGGALGTARARAAALLMLALPGSAYLYAGDELGLPQAVVPDEAKTDPIFFRSGGERAGRDGCRVPMPWNDSAGVGFSPDGAAEPWLPIPAEWSGYAVSGQTRDGGSMLTLYRRALALRAAHPALGSGDATVRTDGDVLTVRCVGDEETVRCVVNMGSATVLVRARGEVLLASTSRVHASAGSIALPPNTAVWLTED
ncbi:glycoside hydrolase family 13 protein [Modestobacter sp. VKM Ac-2977]|uniref:glycoside hydrolase family 13 protein n=1 Tax=Modestobacter sp. VKM Ac-2977 TaxID=3004131 RepID=UPI0022A9F80C|nr:glycoside hydrolase family 13 protein [Modestobacter sp. VKM Ac-2977]MCZ2819752.1 glycoside hydrolase family 13 protein [Modestobacter sp. VKM Ac-2977]